MPGIRTLIRKYEKAQIAAHAAEERAQDALWAIALYVREVSDEHAEWESIRRSKVKEIQREFYHHCLTVQLAEHDDYAHLSAKQLADAARDILDKKTRTAGRKGSEYRTPEEERIYATLRMRWTRLMQMADAPATDSRGGYWRI